MLNGLSFGIGFQRQAVVPVRSNWTPSQAGTPDSDSWISVRQTAWRDGEWGDDRGIWGSAGEGAGAGAIQQ